MQYCGSAAISFICKVISKYQWIDWYCTVASNCELKSVKSAKINGKSTKYEPCGKWKAYNISSLAVSALNLDTLNALKCCTLSCPLQCVRHSSSTANQYTPDILPWQRVKVDWLCSRDVAMAMQSLHGRRPGMPRWAVPVLNTLPIIARCVS